MGNLRECLSKCQLLNRSAEIKAGEDIPDHLVMSDTFVFKSVPNMVTVDDLVEADYGLTSSATVDSALNRVPTRAEGRGLRCACVTITPIPK